MSKLKIKSKYVRVGVKKPHIYEIGEVVNNSVVIIEPIRNKYNQKAYVVQSVKYPNAEHNIMSEWSLQDGQQCTYTRGKRIIAENSLYSRKEIRKHLIDIEQAKTIAPHHKKTILFKCDNPKCNNTKEIAPTHLVSYGFACELCSVHSSYGQQAFANYSYDFQLGFVAERQLLNSTRIADFTKYNNDGSIHTIVEIHGIQHYQEIAGHMKDAYKNSIEQDEYKRKYCKENNINMIEIDMRVSSFEWFVEQINSCADLPNISKEDEIGILKLIEVNSKYPVSDIKHMYKIEGLPIQQIADELGYGWKQIYNVLKRNGVKFRTNGESHSIAVRCIETGVVYSSMTKAAEAVGLKTKGSISSCITGRNKTAGKHPETNEPLTWEYVTQEESIS